MTSAEVAVRVLPVQPIPAVQCGGIREPFCVWGVLGLIGVPRRHDDG